MKAYHLFLAISFLNCVLAVLGSRRPRFNVKMLILEEKEHTSTEKVIAEIKNLVTFPQSKEKRELKFGLNSEGRRICTIDEEGNLRFKKSIDREIGGDNYPFTVHVSDNFEGGGLNRRSDLRVVVHILDINDNKPKFTQKQYIAHIPESVEINEPVLQVRAKDKDGGRNGVVRYTLQGESEFFKIDANSGELRVKSKLDHELQGWFELEVIATDNGALLQLHTSARVIIYVDDVADRRPHFVAPAYAQEIVENLAPGTHVAGVHAVDGDTTARGHINYEIIAGDEYGLFRIDTETGNVTVKGRLDRESYVKFDLVIKAFEVGNPSSFATIDLKLTLTDLNDNFPHFSQPEYIVNVDEDKLQPNSILTTKIKAYDDDATKKNSRLYYWMDNEVMEQYFKVWPDTGALILIDDITNLSQDLFKFKVYASEQLVDEGSHPDECDVIVQIIRKYAEPKRDYAKSSSNARLKLNGAVMVLAFAFFKFVF